MFYLSSGSHHWSHNILILPCAWKSCQFWSWHVRRCDFHWTKIGCFFGWFSLMKSKFCCNSMLIRWISWVTCTWKHNNCLPLTLLTQRGITRLGCKLHFFSLAPKHLHFEPTNAASWLVAQHVWNSVTSWLDGLTGLTSERKLQRKGTPQKCAKCANKTKNRTDPWNPMKHQAISFERNRAQYCSTCPRTVAPAHSNAKGFRLTWGTLSPPTASVPSPSPNRSPDGLAEFQCPTCKASMAPSGITLGTMAPQRIHFGSDIKCQMIAIIIGWIYIYTYIYMTMIISIYIMLYTTFQYV